MAQDEMKLRLLKKDKIAGETWLTTKDAIENHRLPLHWYAQLNKLSDNSLHWFWRRVGVPAWSCRPITMFDYDSFELGIKVGEEWWFEGDIFKNTVTDYIFVLKHDAYKWLVVDWEKLEHIGNIHENHELINQ